jgi:hypothetical protein
LESRESNNRKYTIGINQSSVKAAGKPKKVDATLGINSKLKKTLKSPNISKNSIISMNKKAIENASEMNKQMKLVNSVKKPTPVRSKRRMENQELSSPIANLMMNNNGRMSGFDHLVQVPSSRNMVYPSTMVMNSSEGPEPPGLYDKYFDESHSVERSPKIPMGQQILTNNNFKNTRIVEIHQEKP